ncbi:MAG: hypothetical protein JNL60_02460 [Bacteroidia bacterium]|nr:hypothetical protein [Bacteroidia bacterium]
MNRVWAYIISEPLSDVELNQVAEAGKTFVEHWTAHENKLSASFEIFEKRIILVKVNEDVSGASGCSIDKLTRFIKASEIKFGIQLLNRLFVAYRKNDKIEIIHSSKIKDMLSKGEISPETPVYNTSVANEEELSHWIKPLKDTWLNRYL